MQQVVVPTSPKSTDDRTPRITRTGAALRAHLLFIVIICALVFGALAGFFGCIIALNLPTDVPLIGNIKAGLAENTQQSPIFFTDRTQQKTVLTQSPAVLYQLAAVYDGEPGLKATQVRFLGNAVVLTADGWLTMPTSLLPTDAVSTAPQEATARIRVILPNGEMKKVEQWEHDPLTGMTLFSVETVNLAVVNFHAEAVMIGQLLSGVEKRIGSVVVSELRVAGEQQRTPSARSTQMIEQDFFLDAAAGELPVGLPLFYHDGSFAGIVMEQNVLLQSGLVSAALNSVVSRGTVERSEIDLNYINIAQLTQVEQQEQQLPDHGWLILAVAEDASGATPFMDGDVITHLNNTFVEPEHDVSTMIHSKLKGSVFFFTIIRDGKEKVIEWAS